MADIDPARDKSPAPGAAGGRRPGLPGLGPPASPRRARLYEIIYEADTPAGKAFDVALILLILVSVLAVMLDSIRSVSDRFGPLLRGLEWALTVAFSIEYVLRLACVRHPWSYARSFFGVVDLLAVLPTYLSLVVPGSQSLLVVRFLRLLRVFRVFKLAEYVREAQFLREALVASRRKIAVFFMAVLTLVVIIGALMYLVEGEASGFSTIPRSVYWAIVTLTTVGFGDITPRTPLGQLLASIVMLIGYSIIAVPTGIVSAEMARAGVGLASTRRCPSCGRSGHETEAGVCNRCGASLKERHGVAAGADAQR
jgi:voltage-gated potassium channel